MSTPLTRVPLDSYWGVIQAAVRERATTTVLWAAVRLATEQAGETLAPGSFQRMNELRGLANGQRRADATLDRAGANETLTSQHISTDINSRDALQRSLAPRFKVGFDVTGTRVSTGAEVTLRLTDTFGPNLPATKGDLLDTLDVEAPALAMDSDLELSEVTGGLSIREV